MLNGLASVLLPPLLVFGLYHLMIWFNIFNINSRPHWKRVALASLSAHTLLATGFFVFSWFEFDSNRQLGVLDLDYGAFLFNRSEFWRVMTIFDTGPMLCVLGLFAAFEYLGIVVPGAVAVTIVVTFVAGGVQWYFLGGAAGALLDRFWTGLKTNDSEEEWFR